MLRLAHAEIARLEESRQALGISEVANEAVPLSGGFMCFTEPGAWTNQAVGLGLEGPVSDAELDALVAFYGARGVEATVDVCPFAHPSLVAGLGARGFRLREFENVFARDLDADVPIPEPTVRGLTIERVDPTDGATVRAFVEASTCGFRPEGEPLGETLFELTRRVVEHPRVTSFLARIDEVPAGGGCVEVLGSVAALFSLSVYPAFRRRGVQRALMAARLAFARSRGCAVATLGSRPGVATERNAARMGFECAYTKVTLVRPGPGG